MREIVFDTETTGLDFNGDDRIIEVGAVELENFVPTGREFQTYINPGRPVSEATVRITGITDDMLVDCPPFEDPTVVDALLDFFGDATIVAHNAEFDRGFLNAALARAGRATLPKSRWVDTLEIAKQRFPGSPASLDALCRRFDISIGGRAKHGALKDAKLLADVYLELRGGRARSFEFVVVETSTPEHTTDVREKAVSRIRPEPLRSRIEPADIEAHARLLADMGTEAIWKRYLES